MPNIFSLLPLLAICASLMPVSVQDPSPPREMITLIDISTPDGSIVDSTTTIDATISYRITGIDTLSRIYTMALMFQGTGGKFFSVPPNDYVQLDKLDSVVHFSYRLQNIWSHKNVSRPFVLTFFLMEAENTRKRIRLSDRIELAGPMKVIATSSPIHLLLKERYFVPTHQI